VVLTLTSNAPGNCIAATDQRQIFVNGINPGTIDNVPTICRLGNPAIINSITPASGSGTISYQWQSNTTGCSDAFTNIPGATGATYDPPAGLTTTTYFRRMATSVLNGVECVDYSNCIVANVNNVDAGEIAAPPAV